MTPVIRTVLLTVGTGGGAALATALFLATKGGDISAVIDQLNIVVVDITKLVALAVPLITAGYAVFRSASTKSKLQDVEGDKRVEGVIVNDRQLASAMGDKVVTPEDVHTLPNTARAISALRTP